MSGLSVWVRGEETQTSLRARGGLQELPPAPLSSLQHHVRSLAFSVRAKYMV